MQISGLFRQHYKFGIWVLVIGYLCLAPADEFKKVHITIPYFDKVVHFGLFFILGIIVNAKREFQSFNPIFYLQVSFAVLYGGLIELAQNYLTTTRKGDWIDWLADLAGLALGIWMIRFLPRKFTQWLK
ncbi:MAG: VanZ family protein [Salinivirgaceae bacterium]|jgi:VanZ family protein